MLELPTAYPGQEITAEMWNAARAAVRANRFFPGDNLRASPGPDGTRLSADAPGLVRGHPFRVSLQGTTAATITSGSINLTIEPQILEQPLSADPAPVLTWSKLKLDPQGRGYIALQFPCDEQWAPIKAKVTVVQVAYFDSVDGEKPPAGLAQSAAGGVPSLPGRIVRWPLAMLRQRSSGQLDLFQLVEGDLQFRASPKVAGADVARCFFF